MGRLDGKVAIVTGGGVGIGKMIARGLGGEGAAVVIAGRRIDRLNACAKELAALGMKIMPIAADVSVEAEVLALFARTIESFRRLDILVNNAGVTDGAPLDEMSLETWEKVMATNLRGPFLCSRSALQWMKAQGSGRILNIGSISAKRPRHNAAAYATSKFGLTGLTTVTALEGRDYGVSACCLHPGNVQVDLSADEAGSVSGIPGYASEPMMKPEEIAEVATLMAALPSHMNMLEAIVLPVRQAYLARG
jgi:NAD(P)-dependent dehydrogenase (short-subunit alcohol dehydrogenase family)